MECSTLHAISASQPSPSTSSSPQSSASCLLAFLPHDAFEPVLEPLHCLLLVDTVGGSNSGLASSALGDTFTGTGPVDND